MLYTALFLVTVVGVNLAQTLEATAPSRKISTRQDDSYVAAVLEYNFGSSTSVNLEAYLGYIREAAVQNADIVVFPELCLNRRDPIEVPNPKLNLVTPALTPDDFHSALVAISQAAIDNTIYVVINVEEQLNCSSVNVDDVCPESRLYLFNTNVVFDRNGTIIDRYRKINLFGEFSRTPSLTRELGVFETDFGVTFGHFICFDLMFQVPAIQVVEKLNISDVIFSTMWFSEAPYLTAVQIQEAYAYALDINFLASGANNVAVGSAGSGIFSGKAGALISTMPGVPTTRLLVSRVPKVPGQLSGTYPGPIVDPPREADSLRLKSDPSLPAHVSRLLQPGFQEFSLTHNEVTCQFKVRMTARGDGVGPQFRALVHDGSNTYARRQIGVASCAVVACQTTNITSCPYRYSYESSNTNIEELDIHMTSYATHYNATLRCENVVYFGSTLQINKFPLHPSNYSFIEKNVNALKPLRTGRETIYLNLKSPQDTLMTFGIWGRIYAKDVDHTGNISEDDVIEYQKQEDSIFDKSTSDEKCTET